MRRRLDLFSRRWMQLATVVLLAVVMLGADDPEHRYNRVGHNLMCVCGCAQVLLECNHVGCPDSARMTAELHGQIESASGDPSASVAPDSSVLNWFAQKYGATVLAAPIRGGFDNVAWIMPMAVFLLGTIGTAFVVRMWSRNRAASAPAGSVPLPSPESDALRARIRRETEY